MNSFARYRGPTPDFESLARCLRREVVPSRVHFAELYLDEEIKLSLGEVFAFPRLGDRNDPNIMAREDTRIFERLGYDMVRVHIPASEFRMDVRSSLDKATGPFVRNEQGYIVHEHGGPVQNREDFEKYPWPRIDNMDLSPLEWANKNLPDGMKAYDLSDQFLEAASWLLGYETFFVNMYEDEEFIADILDRVAECYLAYTRLLCDFDCIGAIIGTDDMGFKTQTMVPPAWLRENILPLHRQAARIAHSKGKLYILHSCGNLESIMDDLVDDVGIDAKHSYEDAIMPVTEIYRKYGARMGVVGGIDVDYLARQGEAAVRGRVRQTLETCFPGGGYVLGSGNSVTNYVPMENFFAMLDEGIRFR